ncbi:AraC family transcriptional regulator [Paenibacillus sp. LHD-38]|uniref:AraC family transcriptional regulator n=1 Tax=Paenibacillus sp. LHD-38 TaxID=3072143 RepID=UPI00280C95FB|nr:AraC family transcriptional regulator [Paenibacillus sp. LHD-38]MDQ8738130.1 AraC family transcriptional regulator [Paenibacillus sp. LHD-38]
MIEELIVELKTPPIPYYLGSGCSEFKIGDHHPKRKNLGIYDLLIVVKGELHIGENGQQWKLTRGDTLLLLPEEEHYSVSPCSQETVFYWVHFEHSKQQENHPKNNQKGILYTSRPFGNPYGLRLPKHSQLSNPEVFFDKIKQLLVLPINNSFWEEQRLLAELLAMLEKGGSNGSGSVAARLAERAAAYIQKNYKEKITNETLASALHFHPNYIVRCMKTKYELTPNEYLHEFRLERAKRLLITTEWPIDRIAEEVGFRYAPYFSACFKRSVGLSPIRFRKQFLK